jgi:hypothetical protein
MEPNPMYLKTSLLFILLLLLSACATQPSINIPVVLGENKTLDFTGKGAAAGIMLDAVMGGAGIAIGIAIDKGIAKDIAKNLVEHKPLFNMVELVDAHIKTAIKHQGNKNSPSRLQCSQLQSSEVIIERYGFKTVSGGDDLVSAWLELSVLKDGRKMSVRYPDEFAPVESASLSSVKANADVAYAMLSNASEQVAKKLLSII